MSFSEQRQCVLARRHRQWSSVDWALVGNVSLEPLITLLTISLPMVGVAGLLWTASEQLLRLVAGRRTWLVVRRGDGKGSETRCDADGSARRHARVT